MSNPIYDDVVGELGEPAPPRWRPSPGPRAADEVPERPDGWCEDRPVGALSDEDGVD